MKQPEGCPPWRQLSHSDRAPALRRFIALSDSLTPGQRAILAGILRNLSLPHDFELDLLGSRAVFTKLNDLITSKPHPDLRQARTAGFEEAFGTPDVWTLAAAARRLQQWLDVSWLTELPTGNQSAISLNEVHLCRDCLVRLLSTYAEEPAQATEKSTSEC